MVRAFHGEFTGPGSRDQQGEDYSIVVRAGKPRPSLTESATPATRDTVPPYIALAAGIGCSAAPQPDADGEAISTEGALDLSERVITSWDGSPAFVNADGIAEVAPLPEGFDPEAPLQPHVIARVELDGYHYEFVRLFVNDEESEAPRPSTLLRTHGPRAQSNPVHELQRSVEVPLTFSEIYTGLTGQEAPDELQSEHAAQARRLSRVEAFQRAVRVPGGAIDKTTDADFTPAIGMTDWVRSAFYVPVGNNVTGQECYGPSTDGIWACFAAFAVSGSDLYADNWDAARRHTIGVTLSRLEAPATTARARTFWAHIVPE